MTGNRSHPPFVRTMFDLSFRRFVTPRIIPWLFVIGVIVVLLYALAFASGFASGAARNGASDAVSIAVWVIVFLIAAALGILAVRVQCEVATVAFRVYERLVPPEEGPVD